MVAQMKWLIKEGIGEVSRRNDSEINTSGPHLFLMAVQMKKTLINKYWRGAWKERFGNK